MQTKKLFSNLVRTGTRLMLLTAMLLALIGNVTGVAAAPPLALSTVTVGAQSGTLTYGTAGNVTFSVSVLRTFGTPASFTLSVTGLPAGATVVSPTPATSFTFTANPRVVTLTINSNGSVAAGPDGFNVQAFSAFSVDPIGAGTLTISQASQTITFGALANKTTADPAFNVSATGGASGNPVTFAALGACTVAGTLVSITGAGSCTITASQAGNANYTAATPVPQTFTITSVGPGTSFDLYAVTGTTTTLPGLASANVWGYNSTGLPVTQPGGPVLTVNQGDTVTVILHNQLSFGTGGLLHENTGLLFQGQSLIPDTTGVGFGLTKTYTFTASQPGTFLYEAGLLPNAQHQVALGLYGALVVRPTGAPLQAYASPATAFNTEQVLVLSELDTTLNASLTPATFDMRKYAPKFFLINGQAYPGTAALAVNAADKVLLRYVNAGLTSHHMGTLGLAQTVLGQDGRPFTFSHKMVSETIAPGQTLDALVTVPTAATTGTRYAVYDSNLMLRNNTGLTTYAGVGGMLTFLTVGTTAPPVDTGPFVTSPGLSPNPTGGLAPAPVTVTATISDVGTLTVNNITAAEFYIDSTAGTAYPMSGAFGSPMVPVTSTAPISTLMLQSLASGNHTIYIRGQDSASTWSPFLSVTLNLDKTGPATTDLSLTPNPSSGAVSVALTATGNDTATGNSNVTAAEYWVDSGSPVAMTIVAGPASSSRNFTATIPSGLSQGTHVVSVRSQDSFGNWGATSTIDLIVADTVPPTTSAVSADPNPNNGTLPFNTTVQAVRVFATFSDAASNIAAGEAFIGDFGMASSGGSTTLVDSTKAWTPGQWVGLQLRITSGTGSGQIRLITSNTATSLTVSPAWATNPDATSQYAIDLGGATGTGFVFIANDGNFDSPAEGGYSDIPLPVVDALSTGAHPICVHAKDEAGNWSAVDCSYNLIIDRTPPTVSSINRVDANPSPNGSVNFLVTFSESVTGVTAGNFTIVRTGLGGTSTITSVTGGGSAWTVTATTGTGAGTLGLNLTDPTGVTDLAGNAMTSTGLPFVGQVYTILPPPQPSLYFSTAGNTNPGVPPIAGTADDADIYFYNTSTSAFTRSVAVTAITNPLPSGANVDGFDRVSATQFYMSFSGGVTVPGIAGTVADEDIVLRNGTTWTLYFDGSAFGLGGTGFTTSFDLDAISVVGAGGAGNIYFSTDNANVPPGTSSPGDDADIYRWDGGSSYTRVVDASAVGWSTANVDGLVWVDATHVYLSYSADTTVPVIGAVQDEDVVRNNGGTWSVYFDGTVLGLGTSGNLDIDAFDLP